MFFKHSLSVVQTYYIGIAMCLKIVLLCLCSNPLPPRPLDVTPGQSCQSQSESVPINAMDKYHTHHTSEPTRQERLTSLKNDLENHLEDFELVSYFLCIKNILYFLK